jgi:hypothetical protein
MKRLRHLLDLPKAERRIVLQALPLVAAVRLFLWVVPFGAFLRFWTAVLLRMARPERRSSLPARRIVWLVRVASRLVPKALCLTTSVAAQLLLARQGHQSTLQIGIRKQGNRLDAHAWLDQGGVPLLEDEGHLEGFTPLPSAGSWAEASSTVK